MPFPCLIAIDASKVPADSQRPHLTQIAESMVLPHMDDIAFMDTTAYSQRGGIYADCIKREEGDLRSMSSGTTASASGNGAPIPLPPSEGETDGRVSNPNANATAGQENAGLMPGVPNLKLGDDRGENVTASSGMRQRPARDRKHSDPASIKSTQSLPIGEQFKLSSMFGSGSVGSSSSSDASSAAAAATAAAKEHSRKRSWFASAAAAAGPIGSSPSPSPVSPSSSVAAAKTRLSATESETALPLAQNSSNAAAEVHGTETLASRSSGRGTPRKSEPPVGLRNASDLPVGDGVAERLRGILETGGTPAKARSASNPFPETVTPPPESPEVAPSLSKLEVPGLAANGLSTSPSGIARTASASSDETTVNSAGPASATSTHSSADYARYLEETAAAARNIPPGLPSLFRRKSDKTAPAAYPAATSTTGTVGNGGAPDAASVSTSASASDVSTLASSSHSSGGSGSLGAGGSALLNTWKQKAADKQAIQDGVAQAKQQMAKWSNKWSTYRKQAAQPASPHPDDDPLAHGIASEDEQVQGSGQMAVHTSAAPSAMSPSSYSTSNLHGLAEGGPSRSRSGSILSSSPTGRFQPAAPIATTSLTTVGGVSAGVTGPGGAVLSGASVSPSNTTISTSPSVRRVPPPSVVPVHPAFSNGSSPPGLTAEGSSAQHTKRASVSGSGRAAGYGRTTMMAVPVMDDSRKFGLSSDDLAKREQQSAAPSLCTVPALPRRPVPPLVENGVASSEAAQPQLPARPAAAKGLDAAVPEEAVKPADGPELPPRLLPSETTAKDDSSKSVRTASRDAYADESADSGVPALPARPPGGRISDAADEQGEESSKGTAAVLSGPPLPPRPAAAESASSPHFSEPSSVPVPGLSVEPPTPSPRE